MPPVAPAQPVEGLDELGLAVAGHAGDAEDLAGADLEAACRPRRSSRDRRRRSRSVDVAGRPRRGWPAPSRRRARPRARPSSRRAAPRSRSSGSASPTTLPRRMTVIRSAISSTSYSLWLMNTMLVPSAARRRRTCEDLDRLLRREDGGRLVEDQDLGAAIERLQDLDPLLDPDRQVADLGVGVDLEPELRGQVADPALRLVDVEEDRVGHRLVAEDDVLGHAEHRDEHEVLVDHADARGRSRRTGWRSATGLPSSRISPSSGREQPVEDVHQGALAGAVLAEQARGSRPVGSTGRSPSLATTPGKRLVMPRISRAGRDGAAPRPPDRS